MKQKRHPQEQMIAIPKEHEAGVKTADLCRTHAISEATFYAWKAKDGGPEVLEAKHLKGLECENAKLKRLLADAMLDNAAPKGLLSKKWQRPPPSAKCDLGLGHRSDICPDERLEQKTDDQRCMIGNEEPRSPMLLRQCA